LYHVTEGKTMNRPQKPRKSKAKPTLHLARCSRCQRPALKVKGRVQCLRCEDLPLIDRPAVKGGAR